MKTAISILRLIAFMLLTALVGNARSADSFAYASDLSRKFGTINLSTGAFTQLGTSSQVFAGMAFRDGVLYASSYRTAGQLFTVNQSNGSTSPIGSSNGLTYISFGSTTNGLFVIASDANLYSLRAIDGTPTLVGSTGLSLSVGAIPSSLSTNSVSLYATNNTSFYKINVNTGASTLIGSTSPSRFSAMAEVEGKMYGGTDTPTIGIATIDVSSGSTTFIGSTPSFTNGFYGLAPVPEPTTAVLMLVGAGVVCCARRGWPTTVSKIAA